MFRRSVREATDLLADLSGVTLQQMLAAGLFGRLLESAQAGARLAQAGLERDVAASIRITWEAFVKLKAMCASPEFVERYSHAGLFHRRKLARQGLENPHLDQATKDRLRRTIEDFSDQIKEQNAQQFTLEQLAREVGMDEGYNTVFRMTSPFVHGGDRALDDYAYSVSGRIAGIQFGPSEMETDLYLSTLTEYVLLATHEIAELFGRSVDSRIEPLYNRLESMYPDGPDDVIDAASEVHKT